MVTESKPWANAWGKSFKARWTAPPPPPGVPPAPESDRINPWSGAWGDAFKERWALAPGAGQDEIPPYAGWVTETTPPTALLCDLQGRPIAELPLTKWSVTDGISRPTEASFTINVMLAPFLSKLLHPWKTTIVFLVEGKPVWGGTQVNSQAQLGSTSITVTSREWTAWLDRVWTTSAIEYLAPADPQPDAGAVILARIDAASSLSLGFGVRPPLSGLRWAGASGAPAADMDFTDQEDEPSPRKILEEITTLAQASGIDWQMDWVREGENYFPKLRTFKFDPDAPALREIVVGTDCATATLEINSDNQANKVRVVGKSDTVTSGGNVDLNNPPLWRALSYDRVVDPTTLASRLRSLLEAPSLVASEVMIPGARAGWTPGDMVRLVVPSDFDARYPQGVRVILRVMEVRWEGGAEERTTTLSLASLFDQAAFTRGDLGGRSQDPPAPTPGRVSFEEAIRSLKSRVVALELQRPTFSISKEK